MMCAQAQVYPKKTWSTKCAELRCLGVPNFSPPWMECILGRVVCSYVSSPVYIIDATIEGRWELAGKGKTNEISMVFMVECTFRPELEPNEKCLYVDDGAPRPMHPLIHTAL